jgi:hypothetical protein
VIVNDASGISNRLKRLSKIFWQVADAVVKMVSVGALIAVAKLVAVGIASPGSWPIARLARFVTGYGVWISNARG